MVRAYVGKDVTISIGSIKVAQAEEGRIRYEREVQISTPLGQEEKILRPGGRLVRWSLSGNQVNITSWAFAIGADDILKVADSQATLGLYESQGTPDSPLVTVVKKLFTYDVPLIWEMVDPVSKKSMTFTIKGVVPNNIELRTTNRGYVKMDMDGFGTGIEITDEDISDEDINQLNMGM